MNERAKSDIKSDIKYLRNKLNHLKKDRPDLVNEIRKTKRQLELMEDGFKICK